MKIPASLAACVLVCLACGCDDSTSQTASASAPAKTSEFTPDPAMGDCYNTLGKAIAARCNPPPAGAGETSCQNARNYLEKMRNSTPEERGACAMKLACITSIKQVESAR
jgi:hypothetical protein